MGEDEGWIVYHPTADDTDCFFETFRPTRLCGRGIDWVLVNAGGRDCSSTTPFISGTRQLALQADWVSQQIRTLENATDVAQPVPRGLKLELDHLQRRQKAKEYSNSRPTNSVDEYRDTSRVWHKYRPELLREIDALANNYQCREGKFIIFATEHNADYIWKQIIRATLDNRLGTRARTRTSTGIEKPRDTRSGIAGKNSQRNDRKTFIIEVFSSDYHDLEDTSRVRQRLSDLNLGLDLVSVPYKPEIYSQLGIYSSNRWGLPPTRSTQASKYLR